MFTLDNVNDDLMNIAFHFKLFSFTGSNTICPSSHVIQLVLFTRYDRQLRREETAHGLNIAFHNPVL